MKLHAWIKKNRDFVIIVLAFLLIAIGCFIAMNFLPANNGTKKVVKEPVPVTEPVPPPKENTSEPEEESGVSQKMVGGYFTEISPQDIISEVKEAGVLGPIPQKPGEEGELLPVAWFLFFTHLLQNEAGQYDAYFDTDESGFGSIITCEVDLDTYPQFRTLETGSRVWVAGRIADMSLEGMGSFTMIAEHIRFDGKTHLALFPDGM